MQGSLESLVRWGPSQESLVRSVSLQQEPRAQERPSKGYTFAWFHIQPVTQTHSPVPGISTIRIFAIPPSFASIFLTKIAKLSCLVTDLATYDSLTITWTRQNGEELKTHTNISESHPNATFSATGWTTVCVEDWEAGEEFTCTVTHKDLPSPLKHTIFKPKGRPCPALPAAPDSHGL